MTRFCSILVFVLISGCAFNQTTLSIHNHSFQIEIEALENDWESTDTLCTLFRIENGKSVSVLKFYAFQDNGADCNNAFWSTESMEIKADSVFFTTHYFQRTGLDPIPEWRKQIYNVDESGKFHKLYDRYKYYNRNEWVME